MIIPFIREKQEFGLRFRRGFIHILKPLLGIKLTVYGDFPDKPGLFVCNHRSYIDPAVVLKDLYAFPVSKAEVRKWPLIGYAAKITGIIFVDRENQSSRFETLRSMKDVMSRGYSVLNYPEGTTHDGDKTLAFKPAAFKLALSDNIPIFPIVLDYKHNTDAWVGDDTFFPHFIRCFGKPRTSIKVLYGAEIKQDNYKGAMDEAKKFMDEKIMELRKDWHEYDAQT